MSIGGIGTASTLSVRSLIEMRAKLDDLQRQLATGQKSTDYAGLGLYRGLAVGLGARMAAIGGYEDAIINVGVRISLANTSLSRIADIGRTVKSATRLSPFDIDGSGKTPAQRTALTQLDEMLGLLNTKSGDRYLFAGRDVTNQPVDTMSQILDGDATHAGLNQVMAERNQADLGTSGLGRLVASAPVVSGVTSAFSLSEDAAGSPFGFKLDGMSSTIAGITGPAGVPASIAINLTSNPTDGQSVRIDLRPPDGSVETVTLTATSTVPPGTGQFAIGATPAATADTLHTALTSKLGEMARTSLSAASAIAAAHDFFDIDVGQPPQRVAGPPFDTAIAFAAGTPADTVFWYTGEMGTDSARGTAVARADDAVSVSYGMRANEEGLRWMVEHVAVFASMTYSASDPDAQNRFTALNQRLGLLLDGPGNVQKIEGIEADLAGAQTALAAATDRHRQVKSTLEGLLGSIEGVSNEEVGAQILALQTRLQASLQTTAILYQTSIMDYL